MGRVLALDVGEKTIGVAVSDESGTFAFPGETIWRQEGYRRDMGAIRQLVETQEIERIVVGLPLNMDGSVGPAAERAQEFIETLKRFVSVPIDPQDERLSTSEVERMLIAADRRRDERKKVIDSLAASVFLQRYLECRRSDAGRIDQTPPPPIEPESLPFPPADRSDRALRGGQNRRDRKVRTR